MIRREGCFISKTSKSWYRSPEFFECARRLSYIVQELRVIPAQTGGRQFSKAGLIISARSSWTRHILNEESVKHGSSGYGEHSTNRLHVDIKQCKGGSLPISKTSGVNLDKNLGLEQAYT